MVGLYQLQLIIEKKPLGCWMNSGFAVRPQLISGVIEKAHQLVDYYCAGH